MDNRLYNMRPNFNGLEELIAIIQKTHDTKNFNIIEIGAYTGQSTIFFSNYFNKVITIDPFTSQYNQLDNNDFISLELVYNTFLNNIKEYKNIIHIKETSNDAISFIKNISLNILMVYIDGLHTFDQVSKDILNYKDIIIPGGYLCGHDYDHKSWSCVCDAVDGYKKPDFIFSDTSWLIKQ